MKIYTVVSLLKKIKVLNGEKIEKDIRMKNMKLVCQR